MQNFTRKIRKIKLFYPCDNLNLSENTNILNDASKQNGTEFPSVRSFFVTRSGKILSNRSSDMRLHSCYF